MSELTVRESQEIPGVFIISLELYKDNRGWFKENYQKQKMESLGLPPFEVVQNNFSFNTHKGIARGLHAEPWEKYISISNGSIFGVWVDLRKGQNFGKVMTLEITPNIAVFVPKGVANGYQTLEENITYTYLVNEHWSPQAKYTLVNMQDPSLNIKWPISINDDLISEKDKLHPYINEITPVEV